MLRWVLSVLGAVSGSGCKGEAGEYTFAFPTTEQIEKDLIGNGDPMTIAHSYTFAPLVRVARRDEPVNATAYVAFTMPDGTAVTGKYALKATLRKGYTGGPPGTATERFLEIDDVRLVEKLKPPAAKPGVRGILPGQGIVRIVQPGEIAKLDDRYAIELPADVPVTIWLLPRVSEYGLSVAVEKDSLPVEAIHPPDNDQNMWNIYVFRTTSAGVYEVRVRPDRTSMREPDSYMICVGFGNTIGFGSKEAIGMHSVIFRERPAPPADGKR